MDLESQETMADLLQAMLNKNFNFSIKKRIEDLYEKKIKKSLT